MNILILSVVFLLLLISGQYQTQRCFKAAPVSDNRKKMSLAVIAAASAFVLMELVSGADTAAMLAFELSVCLLILYVMTVSVAGIRKLYLVPVLLSALAVVRILCMSAVLDIPSDLSYVLLLLGIMSLMALFYLYGMWCRLRDVKTVMRIGAVWTGVCLSVDAFYLVSFLTFSFIYAIVCQITDCKSWVSVVYSVLLAFSIASCFVRIMRESEFALWRAQEDRIVESMKISQVDVMGEDPAEDGLYKEIYERLLACFESQKPYLDSELTINEVVKMVYSNKVYISRAIGQFAGRNFRQFVNYYRVMHAVELFRNDPELRITELANRSGFNSPASFNMSFKLFMKEKPGDWCRKERNRRLKSKKLLAD